MDNIKKTADEKMIISVNADKTVAYLTFVQGEAEGAKLSEEAIHSDIAKSGICSGLDNALIKRLAAGDRLYGKRYEIAKGSLGAHGTDGGLNFYFNTEAKSHAPKMTSEGTVDYKNLELIENVSKGDILVSIREPSENVNGMDVYGNPIFRNPGKQAPKLPKGKNTEISADGKNLIASVSGQVLYRNGLAEVSEVLEIKGNVDNSTGNINFNGSVIVKGNLVTGFKIIAGGNVDVEGFVEGGDITANGNISVKKEIIGMNKSKIECVGNITCMLIKNAEVHAGGDIYADGIMHNVVKCGGKLVLRGKKGVLVGGNTVVKTEIDANIIGSPMATVTDIKVGLDIETFESYKKGMEELSALNKKFADTSANISGMGTLDNIKKFPAVKRNAYMKIIQEAKDLKRKIEVLHKEVYALKEEMDKSNSLGRVYGRNVIYSGVNIQAGNSLINIRDAVHCSMAVNENGRIKLVSLV